MSNQDHEWCRDVRRDEQVRAAEDAAAVPSIQHRDLPEQVALLWACVGDLIGRVVRLEGEFDAGQDEEAAPAVCDSASPAEGLRTERVTLEVRQRAESYAPLSEFDWTAMLRSACRGRLFDGESVRVVEAATIGTGDVFRDVGCGSTADEIARLTAERDAAIRERDAAREEYERLRARADPFGEEMAVIAAWERCAITADWPADEPETAMRCAASMEREIVRLRARVAELEAAPAGNTGGEVNQEWIDDMRAGILALEYMLYIFRENCRPFVQSRMERLRRLVEVWRDHACPILSANAGGEPQPPRGWLTAEEREAVDAAADAIGDRIDAYKEQDGDRRRIEVLDGLLARSTPPRVKVPEYIPMSWAHARDAEWIAAIRAAGGEVEE